MGETDGGAELVELLVQAMAIASKEANAHPLDLKRVDMCVGITLVHGQASSVLPSRARGHVDGAGSLTLTATLQRAALAAQDLVFLPDDRATSDLVLALGELIREARTLA